MTKHYLINPTWRCQNACTYCWVEQTVRKRDIVSVPERPMQDWAAAINRDRIELVDIAGGEPLLTGWIPELMMACPNTKFGLSTNGLALQQIVHLCDLHPQNLISINVSYHPESGHDRTWKRGVALLKMLGAWVHSNIVDYQQNVENSERMIEWLGMREIRMVTSPYEEMDGLGEQLEQGLCCKGGVNHLTVAPDGEAWPCLTTLRSPYWEQACLGNWLDGTTDVGRKKQPCHLNCVDYYVLAKQHTSGDMWRIQARECEGADDG